MRHLGTIHNTGSRVIVVFLQLPEAPHKCLCIQTDTLPDYYRETLNRLVQSDEGQAAVDLYTVLARHKMEGVNKDLLTVFHQQGLLLALPVDNILMNPMPNMAVPLREVLTAMGKNVPNGKAENSDQYATPKRFNQFEENQQADLDNNRVMIAKSKLRQAELLEADAIRYRNEAYEMVPSLAPRAAARVNEAAQNFTPQVDKITDIAANYGEVQLDLFSGDDA